MAIDTDQIANDLDKAYIPFAFQLNVLRNLPPEQQEEVLSKWIAKRVNTFFGDKIEALVIAKLLGNFLHPKVEPLNPS